MVEVIVSYIDSKKSVETFSILTYLRGEGFWQFLTTEGSTVCIPDHAIKKIEVHPIENGESA